MSRPDVQIEDLPRTLRSLRAPNAALFERLLKSTAALEPCKSEQGQKLMRLARACAWTDAALGLVDLEQPSLKARRLFFDGAEWHCALSESWRPDWLDGAVEGWHADLSLAILSALAEARDVKRGFRVGNAVAGSGDEGITLCCDNFA